MAELPQLPELTQSLFAYTLWADRHHLDALERLPAEHLTVPTGTSFGTLLATIAHVLGAEQVWLSRFLGAPIERPSESDWPDLASVRAGFEELWPQMEFFIASLTPAVLLTEISWTSRGGRPYRRPIWQAVLHLSHHSGYHRGQLTAMQRQLGHPAPASSDLIAYFESQASR